MVKKTQSTHLIFSPNSDTLLATKIVGFRDGGQAPAVFVLYHTHDVMGSVIATLDEQGHIMERLFYGMY